ncbi:radical SAM domain protein [Candidatus Thiomargarita nelsonii]|uniref:Radical SAM domain protein n=1 Tax=Candidatus Thiomargarita nelsonii TaxID=1003181 RepID=A0A0A6NZC5_9GAMM|nr:radical SAM domain protein [Candidatus Thiomargarita nelsonii]
MTSSNVRKPRIALIELPSVILIDQNGKNWAFHSNNWPLVSKQALIPQLQAGGFDVELVNLKAGNEEEVYGQISWNNGTLFKLLKGNKIKDIDPEAYDAWGITVNLTVEREAACMAVKHLASKGKPVVVGGSDALAVPEPYFRAGATAIVQDKSGAANWAILDYVLGKTPREDLTGVLLNTGKQYPLRRPPMNLQEWPVPSVDVIKKCLGTDFSVEGLRLKNSSLSPNSAIFPDIGCDRKCNFCQTPNYSLGYKKMSIERIYEWTRASKEAGAKSMSIWSDQFLARTLWPDGREEIMEIMRGLQLIGMPYTWGNGLELRKATRGRGFKNSDMTPDEELIQLLWGWDGENGCAHAYIPAERPFVNCDDYSKLMPWQEHCELIRAIVHTGTPSISYGVIIGLPDDDDKGLSILEEAIMKLCSDLMEINPNLAIAITPFAIAPLPGTPLEVDIRQSGLLRFDDPTVLGSLWTSTANTKYMDYTQISDWIIRLNKIGNSKLGLTPNLT